MFSFVSTPQRSSCASTESSSQSQQLSISSVRAGAALIRCNARAVSPRALSRLTVCNVVRWRGRRRSAI
jgi:hypothetical protein